MFWIPEGFAHGFIALEDNTQFLYKTTNYYNKESEGAIIWNDPTLAINWPLDEVGEVLVSDKDQIADDLKHKKRSLSPLFIEAVSILFYMVRLNRLIK